MNWKSLLLPFGTIMLSCPSENVLFPARCNDDTILGVMIPACLFNFLTFVGVAGYRESEQLPPGRSKYANIQWNRMQGSGIFGRGEA